MKAAGDMQPRTGSMHEAASLCVASERKLRAVGDMQPRRYQMHEPSSVSARNQ